jgi:ABC-type antimicrobial peptide transport system permease subunit
VRFISQNYFRTMGIPLQRGRSISDNDRGKQVAVISARLGALLWPGLNPIGRKFNRFNQRWIEVIGVVGDVRTDPEKAPVPILYRPYWDWPQYSPTLLVRAKSAPQSIRDALYTAIRATDPEIPIPAMNTMKEILDERMITRKFEMLLAGIFSFTALAVAGIGIYAVVSYSVTRRTSEIGVRCALGAKLSHIYQLIFCQGLLPVAAGLLVGIVLSLSGGQQLKDMLYEVSPQDAWTIGGAICLLLAVSVIACWIPARRAAGLDPLTALKYE